MSRSSERSGKVVVDEVDDPATDALLNHEAMKDPLGYAAQVVIGCVDAEKRGALRIQGDSDYVLEEGSCWITVGTLSVYVKREAEGVAVDVYPLNDENSEAIASTYAFFADGSTAGSEENR